MCMCMCACACACTTLLAQRAHDPHSHTLVYFFQACCWNIRVAFSFFWQGGRTSGIGLLLPSLFSPIFLLAQILVSTDLGPRAHLAATACLHSLTGDHSQQSSVLQTGSVIPGRSLHGIRLKLPSSSSSNSPCESQVRQSYRLAAHLGFLTSHVHWHTLSKQAAQSRHAAGRPSTSPVQSQQPP